MEVLRNDNVFAFGPENHYMRGIAITA